MGERGCGFEFCKRWFRRSREAPLLRVGFFLTLRKHAFIQHSVTRAVRQWRLWLLHDLLQFLRDRRVLVDGSPASETAILSQAQQQTSLQPTQVV